MRTCTKCGATKPSEAFGRNGARYRSECRSCHNADVAAYKARNADVVRRKNREYMQRYNKTRRWHGRLPRDEYEALLKDHGGRCAICKTDAPGGANKLFCVDHCHTTGAIRGLLCRNCNIGIGFLADDPDRLMAAAEYLRG